MSTRAAALYLGTTDVTLRKWRCEGIGPQWLKISVSRVRYLRADLDAWLSTRPRYQSTSEHKSAARSALVAR